MKLDVALALIIGAVLGVFSTVLLTGLAFAVRNRQLNSEQEDTEQHE